MKTLIRVCTLLGSLSGHSVIPTFPLLSTTSDSLRDNELSALLTSISTLRRMRWYQCLEVDLFLFFDLGKVLWLFQSTTSCSANRDPVVVIDLNKTPPLLDYALQHEETIKHSSFFLHSHFSLRTSYAISSLHLYFYLHYAFTAQNPTRQHLSNKEIAITLPGSQRQTSSNKWPCNPSELHKPQIISST